MLSRVIAFVFAALPLLGCGGDEAVPCPVQTWSATTRCMQTARAGAAGAPEMISSSGCYADVAKHRVDDTLFPYEVASPLWTDGALKRRFIALPDGAQLSAGSSGGAGPSSGAPGSDAPADGGKC